MRAIIENPENRSLVIVEFDSARETSEGTLLVRTRVIRTYQGALGKVTMDQTEMEQLITKIDGDWR